MSVPTAIKTHFVFGEIVPLPASDNVLNPAAVFQSYDQAVNAMDAASATADDKTLLDLSLRVFDDDGNRRASIDSRAAGMMSAIALVSALVTGVGFTTLKGSASLPDGAFWTMFLTFAVTLLYLTATIWLLFRIQGRVVRATLDPTDLQVPPAPPDPTTYPRRVAIKILRYTIFNYRVNNRIVGQLWAAQKCFRNGLLVLVVGGLATTAFLIPPYSSADRGLKLSQALARAAGCSDLPSLTLDSEGHWHGTCLLGGTPVSVRVDVDGQTSFRP